MQKYGCNKGLILLEHSTFKGIAFTIAMWSCKFNKYLCLHLQKGSLVFRACCISEITQQQTKSPSSNVRRFIMEITKSEKMHKFIKSLNISLVETSTVIVLIKSFKSCSQSTVSQKNYQGSHFLPFHLFNFLTFTFLQSIFFFLSINVQGSHI